MKVPTPVSFLYDYWYNSIQNVNCVVFDFVGVYAWISINSVLGRFDHVIEGESVMQKIYTNSVSAHYTPPKHLGRV